MYIIPHPSPPAVSLPKPSNESTLAAFYLVVKKKKNMMMSTRIASSLQTTIKTNRCKIQSGPRLACIDSQTLLLDIHLTLSTGYLTLVWLITYYSSDQSLATLLYFLGSKWHVKIRCPDCKEAAELADDFSFVKCSNC